MRHKFNIAAAFYLLLIGAVFSSPLVAQEKLPPLAAGKIKQVNPFLPLMPRKGDLASIKQYGHLRVLFDESKIDEFESNLLEEFAKDNDLNLVYISVKELPRGQHLLKAGMADILLGSADDEFGIIKTFLIHTEEHSEPVSWTIRSKNIELKDAINHHVNRSLITQSFPETYREDLSDLKKRKRLRVVTRLDPKNYSLQNGKLAGFEYELLQKFAESQDLWLDIIIAKDESEMSQWLLEGKADIATINSTDQKLSKAITSLPYYPADNFIITRKSHTTLNSLQDINGKILVLHQADYQQNGIDYLRDKGFIFSTIETETALSMPEFLQKIIDQKYDIAMISAKDYIYAREFHPYLKVIATDNDKPLHRWAVNKRNVVLNTATNSFLRKEFQSEFFNVIYKRNYVDINIEKSNKSSKDFYISPYDKLVKKYSEKYQFDWRLVVAQIYQESQFKPNVRSYAGAKGLMQIMPETAKELGITKVNDPESSIKAGLKYMNILRDRYDDKLPITEKNWFALASYNAGFERIQDARNFAKKLKLDPDKWFGNVEQAMQKMADPKNRDQTRYGFCRCGQTVVYVRMIRKLYNSYIQLTDPLIIASTKQHLLTDNSDPTDTASGLPRQPF